MHQSGKTYWLRSGAFSFLERIGMQLLRFGSFFLLVRSLPKEEFGVWTMFTLISYLSITFSGGLIQRALVRSLLIDKVADQERAIQTASLVLHMLISVGIMGILSGVAQIAPMIWDTDRLSPLLWIHIAMTAAYMPLLQCQYVLQANMRFEGIFFSTITRQGIIFVFIAYQYLGMGQVIVLEELAWCYVGATAVAALVAMGFGWPYLKLGGRISKKWMRRLLRFGSYSTGTQISYVLMRTIDQLMVGALVSVSAAAGYGAAVRVANLVEVPTQSMGNILFPQSTKQLQQKGPEAVRKLFEKSVGFILALIIPGGIMVWLIPERVLMLIAGPQYVDMVDVLRIALLAGLQIPFLRQFTTIMESIGKPQINFKLMAGGTIVYTLLVYVAILIGNNLDPVLGGTLGAAIGVSFAFIFIVAASMWTLNRELGVRFWGPLYYVVRVYRRGFLVVGELLTSGKVSILKENQE